MTKKILKKLAKYSAIACIGACILVPGAAFANNHTDVSWSFYSLYGGSGDATKINYKEDTTSVYINCTGLSTTSGAYNGYFRATPYGSRTKTGTYSNMVYVKNGISYSAASHAIYRGTVKKMPSYIYEAGGRYAKIHYSTSYGHTGFSGVWSPDSI